MKIQEIPDFAYKIIKPREPLLVSRKDFCALVYYAYCRGVCFVPTLIDFNGPREVIITKDQTDADGMAALYKAVDDESKWLKEHGYFDDEGKDD